MQGDQKLIGNDFPQKYQQKLTIHIVIKSRIVTQLADRINMEYYSIK